jgi:hypothetical protein
VRRDLPEAPRPEAVLRKIKGVVFPSCDAARALDSRCDYGNGSCGRDRRDPPISNLPVGSGFREPKDITRSDGYARRVVECVAELRDRSAIVMMMVMSG